MPNPQPGCPISFFTVTVASTGTAQSIGDLITAYFTANRPGDLPYIKLACRSIQYTAAIGNSNTLLVGDWTVATGQTGVELTAGAGAFEAAYGDTPSIDLTTLFVVGVGTLNLRVRR
jgi:hypothetical protein